MRAAGARPRLITMTELTLLAIGLGGIGALLLALGLRRLLRRRLLSATVEGLGGGLFVALGALVGALGLNLHTYQRLTYEQEIAVLEFRQLAPQRYLATLRAPGSTTGRRYELLGDEWQLDARVIKWHGVANLLGLDSRYRLERLGGRYREVADESARARSVHALAEERGLPLTILAEQDWLPWLDAYYGSAAYLPMADAAEYRVSLTQSGLVARPANDAARSAVGNWR